MAIKYYVGNKISGLSTDTKPTTVPIGTVFYETDTAKEYVFDGTSWSIIQGASESDMLAIGLGVS